MFIGYARVSTTDQHTDFQRDALDKAGCERIFEEKISGIKDERPVLNKTLRALRRGDTLVVWKLDRLGRSLIQLIHILDSLRRRGIHFRSVTDSIDTSTPMGRFVFHIMGAMAEMERELIIERTRAGIAAARQQGRHPGRRDRFPSDVYETIIARISAGESRKTIAHDYGFSESHLYRRFPVGKSNKPARIPVEGE
ncbi:recombinase family protein [Pectobacterium betavasculorum]|uniref:recombinase family protein n=1 Tax=Pectobacterium betavasculorum TaxID=55207 RepID=UPI00313C8D61